MSAVTRVRRDALAQGAQRRPGEHFTCGLTVEGGAAVFVVDCAGVPQAARDVRHALTHVTRAMSEKLFCAQDRPVRARLLPAFNMTSPWSARCAPKIVSSRMSIANAHLTKL
jgi:hypothetical protein